MLFTVPSTGGFIIKPYFSLVLKIIKKIHETRKLESTHEKHFMQRKNEGRKPDKIRVWQETSLCPETWTKNDVQEFHLWTKNNTLPGDSGLEMTDLSVVNDEEGEEEGSAHRHGCVGQFPAHKHLSTMTCRQNKTLLFWMRKLFYLEESTHAEDEEAAVEAGSHAWEIIYLEESTHAEDEEAAVEAGSHAWEISLK